MMVAVDEASMKINKQDIEQDSEEDIKQDSEDSYVGYILIETSGYLCFMFQP